MEREHSESATGLPQSRKSKNEDELSVQVRYRDVEKTFSGSAESVWLSLNRFFNEFLPTFEVAQRLTLTIDLQKLSKDCEGIISFAKEGPYLLVPRSMLTDNETLSLLLLAGYLAHQLTNAETDEVSKEELQNRLGKHAKIASTRLGELVKNQTAAKTRNEKYKITTLGLMQMQRDIIPRIKAKMGN